MGGRHFLGCVHLVLPDDRPGGARRSRPAHLARLQLADRGRQYRHLLAAGVLDRRGLGLRSRPHRAPIPKLQGRPQDVTDGAANNKATKYKTSDLCWVSYNAVMSLAGRRSSWSRRAPQHQPTEVYRPMKDDGTRVEYRRVRTTRTTTVSTGSSPPPTAPSTTTASTRWAAHADTDSVFTVPVYGNHPGEPCHQAAFADSRCAQAWHWGLDKVVDVNDNA